MPLKSILRMISQNPQLIEKLSETPAMKRAAQITAYYLGKSQDIGEEKAKELQDKSKKSAVKFVEFTETFSDELKKGFKELQEEMEKEKQLKEKEERDSKKDR